MSLNTGNAILSNAITVDSTYKVGIGTSTLTGKLTISTPNTTSTAAISLRSASLPTYGIDIDQEDVSYGYMAMYSVRANARTLGLVQSWGASTNGYVGIGTSTMSSIFNINGTDPLISFQNSGSTKWQVGLENTASNRFVWYDNTAAAYRMMITSGGMLGVGVGPNAWDTTTFRGLQISSGNAFLVGRTDGVTDQFQLGVNAWFDGTNWKYGGNGAASRYYQNSGGHIFDSASSGTTGGTVTFTERMRITSGGAVCMNTTTGAATLNLKANSANRAIFFQNPSGADGSLWLYGTASSIDYSFSTWSVSNAFYLYNNGNYDFAGSDVSDRRLKQNIEIISYNAIDKLMQLVPKSYNMITHPDIKKGGFIAQEVREVLPDLINGEEKEGEYLGLDYNGLLAVAIKAIQEQQAMIEAQQQQINQLINK